MKGKGPTVQEQLRKTNDDVHRARLHLAEYGKKRMNGKSYRRALAKVEDFKDLQDLLTMEWLKEKGVEFAKDIGKELGETLLGNSIALEYGMIQRENGIKQCIA